MSANKRVELTRRLLVLLWLWVMHSVLASLRQTVVPKQLTLGVITQGSTLLPGTETS